MGHRWFHSGLGCHLKNDLNNFSVQLNPPALFEFDIFKPGDQYSYLPNRENHPNKREHWTQLV
jgi:hypothetical protein